MMTASRAISLASSPMRGIMIVDRPRQPNQAFVIAQRGDIAGYDGWGCLHQIGLKFAHLVTPSESGRRERGLRIGRFGGHFTAPAGARGGGARSDFGLCKARRLCYTLPAANACFACSSVAQR